MHIKMKNIWTEVIIGNQRLPIVQLSDNGQLCIASDMNMQSYVLKTQQSVSKILIKIRIFEGDNVNALQPLKEAKLELSREKSISFFLGRLIGGNGIMNIKINVFYNKADSHSICIGFVSQYFQSNKYIVFLDLSTEDSIEMLQHHNSKLDNSENNEKSKENPPDAKDCFIRNIDKFAELIPLTSIQKNKKIVAEWEETILSIQQSSALYADFLNYKQNLDVWLLHLKSWGVKQDSCKEYPGCLIDSQRYFTEDGAFDTEKQYVVLSPCWTLWKNNGSKNEEVIVSVGLIKEK